MKEIDSRYVIMSTFLIVNISLLILLAVADVPTTEDEPEEHQCTTFIKYNEHYMVSPLMWNYRESFKCVECGKDYKEVE